jgi:hypothetical protein
MNTTIIEVKFADPPMDGKKLATIKTTTGDVYGVWPNMLALFRPGQSYQIEFSERQFNGRTYRKIAKCTPQQAGAPSTNGRAHNGHAITDAKDAERAFVCSILNAAIQGGQVEFTRQAVGTAVQMLRGVWQATFGEHAVVERAAAPPALACPYGDPGPLQPARRRDLDDEIPF